MCGDAIELLGARLCSHEMSEIGKYHPADFVGAALALNYPLTAADIEFFRVNLQNSNCISHCAVDLGATRLTKQLKPF